MGLQLLPPPCTQEEFVKRAAMDDGQVLVVAFKVRLAVRWAGESESTTSTVWAKMLESLVFPGFTWGNQLAQEQRSWGASKGPVITCNKWSGHWTPPAFISIFIGVMAISVKSNKNLRM
eukprot:s364_g20.t1